MDELRLVYGATMDLLAGEDLNRNGVLDANEKNLNGNGQMNPGLFEYMTVYTREPNFHSDGSSLTNVNTATQQAVANVFPKRKCRQRRDGRPALFSDIRGGGTGRANPATAFWICAVRCRNLGMSEEDFAKIYNDVTTSTNTYFRGRVNVNTAGRRRVDGAVHGAERGRRNRVGRGAIAHLLPPAKSGQPRFHRRGSLTRWETTAP